MKRILIPSSFIFMISFCLHYPSAMAFDISNSEIGVHGGVNLGDGEPANDILVYGLVTRYHLKDSWLIGFEIDQYDFDFEYPYKLLGVENSSTDAIDSKASALKISSFIERRFFEKPDGFSLHSSLGLGINMVDVEDSSGPNSSGGFEITTDAGTEYVFSVAAGPRYNINENWSIEGNFGIDYHIADWKVEDRISGEKAVLDDYLTYPVYLGVNYKF